MYYDRAASLFRAYRSDFLIGAAVNSWNTDDPAYSALIRRHFNSITAENEMKPCMILDREGTLALNDPVRTAQNFEKTDKLLAFARDNGIRVRFHVLCWHGQTPRWFFAEGWSDAEDAPTVSPELLLARQEAYIRDVMTHVNTAFPGTVYAYDVVNEAIEPDQGMPGGYRSWSPWYGILKESFIPAAFRAARKYQAPGQKLFYNDYNCMQQPKLDCILAMLRSLKDEDLVDGMGMQAHLMMDSPSVAECETAARAYAALGLEIQATELDIHCPGEGDAPQLALAGRYDEYFTMLLRLRREGINVSAVTFWGLTDRDSWLTGFRKELSRPLLFTAEKETKPAFDAVIAAPEKENYFRLNQIGYAEGLPQTVAVLTDRPVTLKDGQGNELKTFTCTPEPDEASGDKVALAELGPLPAGDYTLNCGNVSRAFTVRKRPWKEVTNALIRGLYFQRCGCALEEKHAGVYAHPACHTAPARLWENKEISVPIPGGWHDAGDYGKYVVPGAVAVAHLLYTWLLFPEGCGDDLNIPESGNGVPDILNEARWELEWILKMQRDDGAFHHKLTTEHFAAFIMPEDDTAQEYLLPVSSTATADAVAVCALAARVWGGSDKEFAARLTAAAEKGWDWMKAHPDHLPCNAESVRTGTYSDRSDHDERFWAACEMFALTGDPDCRRAAENALSLRMDINQFGWADVSGLGFLCCLFILKEKAGDILYTGMKPHFLSRADEILDTVRASGYGTALRPDQYIWGSILPLMNNAIALILAHLLSGKDVYRDAALLQLNYASGLNAMDLSFITGFGQKRVMFPHHRPSAADGIAEPVPGLISGGPNSRWNYGITKEILPDHCAPAKCFLDETPSADTNEIAIYWNSPTVFVSAFFNQLTARSGSGETDHA